MRASRLIVAALLIPVAALLAYFVALHFNFDDSYIDSNGSAIGVLLVVASTFGVAKVADDDRWSDRSGVALALGASYFLLTWVRYGDPSLSADSQPHMVWFGLCIAAFMPAVVIIPASKWAWSTYRARVPLSQTDLPTADREL